MTRYTRDEAVNKLSPDQSVYICDDAGYRNSTLQFLVDSPNLAGSWPFETAFKLTSMRKDLRSCEFEPVPPKIESVLDGIALASAIMSVPPNYTWLLRSKEDGTYFANVMTPGFMAVVDDFKGEDHSIGHSFRAIADTPQEALNEAVRQSRVR